MISEAAGRRLGEMAQGTRIRSRRHVLGSIAKGGVLFLLTVLIAVALIPQWFATHDPSQQIMTERLQPPTRKHLGGTDRLGRDVYSRVVYATRISMVIGTGAALAAGTLGVAIGLVAGYHGGLTETSLMRVTDAQSALPAILLAIVMVAAFGTAVRNLIAILVLVSWVDHSRIIFNVTRSLREREFVLAARALGSSDGRIIFRHILANAWSPIIVVAAFQVPQMILGEAALSFLGLGVQPPQPTWGNMLSEGRALLAVAPWLAVFPGLAIFITVLTINLGAEQIRASLTRGPQ